MHPLESQVKQTIEKHGLIKKGDSVLACVSGGPDSTSLLYALVSLRSDYDLKLSIAHLDHMLRPKFSAADMRFVKDRAAELGLPFFSEKINVKRFARRHGLSVEEAGRRLRYDFFSRAASSAKAANVATAHTCDDQAETVLMRLIQGAGSLGLSGIPYKRRLGNKWVIRPLLDVSRKDVDEYIRAKRISFRLDATNTQPVYLRNRIRRVLLPFIESRFSPNVKESLRATAITLSDEYEYLSKLALKAYSRLAVESGKKVVIDAERLSRLHVSIQRLIARRAVLFLKNDLRNVGFRHWLGIENVMFGSLVTADLPGGIRVSRRGASLVFCASRKKRPAMQKSGITVPLPVPGCAVLRGSGKRIVARFVKKAPRFAKGRRRASSEYVDADGLVLPLQVRTWRSGDRMKPLGMADFKKLQDLFTDEKISKGQRSRVPLVISGKKIVWAAGVRLSDDFKLTGSSGRIVKLSLLNLPLQY